MEKEKTPEEKIGRRIALIRKEKGYTQMELAEMVDLSTNYLSDIERGKSSARLDKLVAIMDALQCSADEVFCDAIAYGYAAKASLLSERLAALPEKERQKVLAVLDVLMA